MIHNKPLSIAFCLSLAMSQQYMHAGFGYWFGEKTKPATNPPAQKASNASTAAKPSTSLREIVKNAFGALDKETEEHFVNIVTEMVGTLDTQRGQDIKRQVEVNGLSLCVQYYALTRARTVLPNESDALKIAISLALNARAQMTQYPHDYNLRPFITEKLEQAIQNKIFEKNSQNSSKTAAAAGGRAAQ